MSSFILRSACRGCQPRNCSTKDTILRNNLINKLMEERRVLRLIKAPDGFGKSLLAAQYADVVFSFGGVFWLNCQSPCFLRDLDSESIMSQVLGICEHPKLLVFDDLPHLDEDRTLCFSRLVDDLLEFGCEVIASVTPVNETILKFQKDSYVILSSDLLVDDDMCKNDVEKIPIVYYNDNNTSLILDCLENENLAIDVKAAVFTMYVNQKGSLASFKNSLGEGFGDIISYLSHDYVYFGIDELNKKYDLPKVDIYEICRAFGPEIDVISKKLGFVDKNNFGESLVKKLANENNFDRAFEVLVSFCKVKTRAKYLSKFNKASIKTGSLFHSLRLFESVNNTSTQVDVASYVFQSIRLMLLGDFKEATKLAYNVLDNNRSSIANKILSTYVFMLCGTEQEKHQAFKIIEYYDSNDITKRDTFIYNLCINLSNVFKYIYLDQGNVFEYWLDYLVEPFDDVSCVCATVILKNIKFISSSQMNSILVTRFLKSIFRFIHSFKKQNFLQYLLISSYNEACNSLKYLIKSIPKINDKKTNKEYKMIDEMYTDQKRLYSHFNFLKDDGKEKVLLPMSENQEHETLYVNMLGGLEVKIGDKMLSPEKFARQKIKVLLTILTLKNGNEVSKDLLAQIIWPYSDDVSRRKNLNSIWCLLNKALSPNSKYSPYLIRNQKSYYTNMKYIKSDVQLLENFCSEFTMGVIDPDAWYKSYKENKKIFDSDLLPSEVDNEFICNKRRVYKDKLVNAFLAATKRLLEIGESDKALWFANKALERDPKREDVYLTLMSVQLACEQRSPAMETYLACKNFLEKDLGLEPTKKMTNLYKKAQSDFS